MMVQGLFYAAAVFVGALCLTALFLAYQTPAMQILLSAVRLC